MLKLLLLILINLCSSYTVFAIIDYSLTKMITINVTGSYFGYSVLLQKGNPPIVIVGAPRKKHGSENIGSVFKCDLNSLRCDEYNKLSKTKGIHPKNKNGEFLGSVLEGEDTAGRQFFTCAPRFIIELSKGDYYTNGKCLHIKDSINVNETAKLVLPLNSYNQIGITGRTIFYDAAFGEAGFNTAFIKEENELLMGAPGKSLYNGALLKTNILTYKVNAFSLQPDFVNYHDNYFGYAVAWGKFIKGSQQIRYVSGAPRGSELKGQVVFFDRTSHDVKEQLFGEEFGSYFGASLLVIHYNNEGDDILVGAPMYSGNSWDEGCVYYYKNKNDGTFSTPIKLSSKKSASRFGTVMADIGDINLDSFTDFAISAPYEDDGIGAVYLYFGTQAGFSNDKFYRIAPSHFSKLYPNTGIRGFGMGISKGNDINNDKHNDLAIGAFLSDQVFHFTTNQIFDVTKKVTPSMKTLYTSTTNFSVEFCITFNFRNGDEVKKLLFFTRFVLDDERVLNRQNETKLITLSANQVHCTSKTIFLKTYHLNVEPLMVNYGHRLNTENQLSEKTFNIPMSYECGTDNVCQTNLSIESTRFDLTKIIVGLNNELKVNVTISNSGESAYQIKLHLKVPPEISLINLRECDFENGTYICLVAQVLSGKVEKNFLFDLANLHPNETSLPLYFKVESVGQDVHPFDNEVSLHVPIILLNSPHLESQSIPESVFVNTSENILKITHLFLVGNYGPSPLDLNLAIFVPQVTINSSEVFEIISVEGFVNSVGIECDFSKQLPNVTHLRTLQNNTKTISCVESHCVSLVCRGGYFPKSNKNAAFALKLTIHVDPLVRLFEDEEKLILVTSAYYTNGTQEFFATASTQIYRMFDNSKLPLWIYIASATSGVLLLLLLIYSLYKCNFFKRSYKDLMENERSGNNVEGMDLVESEEKTSEDD